MQRTFSAHLLAAAFLASAVTATPIVASAGPPNVCGLVTTAEASSAMGTASLPGKAHTSRRSTSCRYYSSDHTKNVFVQTSEAGDMMGAGQIGGKPVAGIGDKAVWAAGSMFVQKGGKYMQVGLHRNAASMQKMDPQIVALAKAVAGRM